MSNLSAFTDFDKHNEYIFIQGVSLDTKSLLEYMKNDLGAVYDMKSNGYMIKNYKAPRNVQAEDHLLNHLKFIEKIELKANTRKLTIEVVNFGMPYRSR
jgi:hypothetical protein